MATFDQYMEALKAVIAENDDNDALQALDESYRSSGAVITTAHELDQEAKTRLTQALEHIEASEGARFLVDPAILGGVIIRLGEREVDRSVARRIRQFAG